MRLIPRTLMLEITRLCNLRCEYCYHYSMKRVKGREWPRFCLPEALLSKFNISDVVITGGEPLLEYNKLVQILKYYCSIISNIELLSNGVLLTEDKVADLVHLGVTNFAISLDSLHPNIFFKIRGVQLNPIVDNLRRMCDKDNLADKITLLVVLSQLNAELAQLAQLVALAQELEIKRIKVQPVTILHLPEEIALRYKIQNIEERLKEIRKLDPQRIVTYQLPSSSPIVPSSSAIIPNYNCPIGKYLLYLDYLGHFSPCPIRSDLLTDFWEDPDVKFDATLELIGSTTINCSLKAHCLCLFPEEGGFNIADQ